MVSSTGLWFIACLARVGASYAGEPAVPKAGSELAATPEVAELKGLESRVIRAVRKALPAIVAVGVTRPGVPAPPGAAHHLISRGSGVIITGEGLILSQWHVSHRTAAGEFRGPGDLIDVVLQDGRRLEAELLGADPVRDLSLLRITARGEYPHLDLARPSMAVRGDFVLKLGHPYGYRASRGATARLGRVLYLGESIELVADCLTFAGDSGGPLINLDGEVAGIIENASAPQFGIWNLPERSGNLDCYSNVVTIARLMPGMRDAPRGTRPGPGFRVTDLPEHKAMMPKRLEEIYGDTDEDVLPTRDWTQGENRRAKWNARTKPYSTSVVEVLGGGRRVAFGTVVDADGWILTKASEIPEHPRCRLPDDRIVPARVAAIDAAYDLALLKVEAHGLSPVEWSVEAVTPAGRFAAAPDGRGGSIGVGIVSVAERSLEGPFPTAVTKSEPYVPKPTPPEVLGKMVDGKGLLLRRVKGAAAAAGLVPGDLLLSLNGRPLRDHDDVDRSVEGRSPGDLLPAVIERGGRRLDAAVKLEAEPYVRCPGANARYRNLRADDFPSVFEHDIPLTLDECGGPVVDLDGKAIGITIARVAQHGCMAIPADAVAPLVKRLREK